MENELQVNEETPIEEDGLKTGQKEIPGTSIPGLEKWIIPLLLIEGNDWEIRTEADFD